MGNHLTFLYGEYIFFQHIAVGNILINGSRISNNYNRLILNFAIDESIKGTYSSTSLNLLGRILYSIYLIGYIIGRSWKKEDILFIQKII